MSLARLMYYSAVIGGWAAFVGWIVAEFLFFRSGAGGGTLNVLLVGGIVGGAIGAGLGLVQGMSNPNFAQLLLRALPGLIGGTIGGAVGGAMGDILFQYLQLPRALGWLIVGLGIGAADGIYEQSVKKIRNGLIGGAIGGLIGGLLFDPLQQLVASASGMSSRALAFTILGICIGALIGLAQVVLKDAWLTVLDGYRPGRQLILSRKVTKLGRGDHLPLPFLGANNQDLELEHASIVLQADGSFALEDNRTRLGTRVNNQLVQGTQVLKDGDTIKLASNTIRFNERRRSASSGLTTASTAPTTATQPKRAPPPPPAKKTAPPPAKTTTATSGTTPTAESATRPVEPAPPSSSSTATAPPAPKRGPPPPPPRPKK